MASDINLAHIGDSQMEKTSHKVPADLPELTNTELVQLRVRVIALENLVISLLADASDGQLDRAREMAAYISPRPGYTRHPLTTHAAEHMVDLVARVFQFRTPPSGPDKRTLIFDENTLPTGLRSVHRTKPGVWGLIRVLEGRLRYRVFEPPSEVVLMTGYAGLLLPDQLHLIEPLAPMRVQIEFHNRLPGLQPHSCPLNGSPDDVGASVLR